VLKRAKEDFDVRDYQPIIWTITKRLTLTREEREDLEQEALIHLYECLDRYDGRFENGPGPYFKICASRFIFNRYNQIRLRKLRECALMDETVSGSRQHQTADDRLHMDILMAKLSANISDHLALDVSIAYYRDGFSTSEVLEMFDITEERFRVLVAKFRREAQRILTPAA